MLLNEHKRSCSVGMYFNAENLVNLCKSAVALTIDTMNDMATIQIIFLEKIS
jgi:hypothetical protein